MEMTIKELADELGVSKDKIKYRVGKLPSNYLVKKNGVTYLKSEGIQAIREQVGENSPVNSLGNYPPFTQYDKVVDLLEKELDVLRKQLEEKDRQLEQAHKLIDQEQQLRMVTEQKLILLEEKTEEQEEVQKKPWWKLWK
jgi:DNA-binding Lrp family transcriptional regulator